ncbi:hypothetical protein [Thalassovita sp.]|uniref:hypothetical protein n=1 Tax=Thalassovita sp. TaxID=1979401 RepID=UPI002AB2BDB3|nr:hypothetical protein [Thalassovita sp.]
MEYDPTKPLVTLGRFVFDLQVSPRLTGESMAHILRYKSEAWNSFELRLGSVLFFFETARFGVKPT